MKPHATRQLPIAKSALLFVILNLAFVISAHAQWKSESYSLNGGWNSIYLHGDAVPATAAVPGSPTMADLFSDASIAEVWRWNPNPDSVLFTSTPLIPAPGTPEWSVWKRDGSVTTLDLSGMVGQSAYLVNCTAVAELSILQKPLPPSSTWVRHGANLLGFPSFKNGANYPSFSQYFATFPAAIAANTKVFKYVGGDLGPGNPLQIFSPTFEKVDRNAAYWFSSEVVGDFYAPFEISLSNNDGLVFGRTGSLVTARLRNRTAGIVTLTLAEVNSANAPGGAVVPPVPLTRGSLTDITWSYAPLSGANNTVIIAPQTTVEVRFGVDRADPAMTAAAVETLFASLLRITSSDHLVEIDLPVSAQKASLAGLWAGDVVVDRVDSRVIADGGATATAAVNGSGEVSGLTMEENGFGYSRSTVTVPSTQGLSVGNIVEGPGIAGTDTVQRIVDETHLQIGQTPVDGTYGLSYYFAKLTSSAEPQATTLTVPDTTGLFAGMAVTGTGITGSTAVMAVLDGTSLEISDLIPDATNNLTFSKTLSSTSDTNLTTRVTVPSTAGLTEGMTVTGPGITGAATIVTIIDGTSFVLSENIPDASNDLTFATTTTLSSTTTITPSTETKVFVSNTAGYEVNMHLYAYTEGYRGIITGIVTNYYLTMIKHPEIDSQLPYLEDGYHVVVLYSSSNSYLGEVGYDFSTPPSPTITVSSTSGLVAGMGVTGPGITGPTTISSITDATHLVLSEPIPVGTRDLTYSLGVTLNSTSDTNLTQRVTVSTTTGLTAGMTVTGPGISGTATIVSILNGTQFVLSQTIPDATNNWAFGTTNSLNATTATGAAITVTVPSTSQLAVNYLFQDTSNSFVGTIVSIIDGTTFTAIENLAYSGAPYPTPGPTLSVYYDSGTNYVTELVSTAVSETVSVPSTVGLVPGMAVEGSVITSATTISSVTNSTDLVLSQAIPTGSHTLYFGTGTLDIRTATTATTTFTVTVGSTTGLAPGTTVTGPDITGSATITSITDATHFELSQALLSGSRDLAYAPYALSSTSATTTTTLTVADTTGLAPGMTVTGPGITGSATIFDIVDSTHLNITQEISPATQDLVYGERTLSAISITPPLHTVTVPDTQGLQAGMVVGGPGITGAPTIASITDGTHLVLSEAIPFAIADLYYDLSVRSSTVVTPAPPAVVLSAPGAGGVQATATAIVTNGTVTGFTLTNAGSGYSAESPPQVTIASSAAGTVPRPFPLRTLLHVADDGTARLLSQVFVGTLSDEGHPSGLCTKETGLKPGEKAEALRFVVTHLPLDQVIDGTSPGTNSGSVALGDSLVRTVILPHNDPTNPFLHQYHPDHDSKDARPDGTNTPLGGGIESYQVTRTLTFTFTAVPPEGVSPIGWGSSVIGGSYAEVLRGLHKDVMLAAGTFTLRRVSEIGTLTVND